MKKEEFRVSRYIILYKLIFGLIEASSGLVVVFFGHKIFNNLNISILRELSEDPHDLLAKLSQNILPGLFTHNTLIVIYLIILGIAKIAGAIGLINKQNWGVDLLVGLTVILFPFQLVDLIVHPSVFKLLYLTVGILIALYLIEYKPKAWISRIMSKVIIKD